MRRKLIFEGFARVSMPPGEFASGIGGPRGDIAVARELK
jgi:hypothetical protein